MDGGEHCRVQISKLSHVTCRVYLMAGSTMSPFVTAAQSPSHSMLRVLAMARHGTKSRCTAGCRAADVSSGQARISNNVQVVVICTLDFLTAALETLRLPAIAV
jgi:hypothetical protein